MDKLRASSEDIVDAKLTALGVQQALKAGTELNKYLSTDTEQLPPIKFIFASDLQRTQYTVYNIASKIDKSRIQLKQIYILPCSHEIMGKKGRCDDVSDPTYAENRPKQLSNTSINGIPLVWTYYTPFSRINKRNKTQKCRNSNMFIEIISIINKVQPNSGSSDVASGKKRKTHKHKNRLTQKHKKRMHKNKRSKSKK